VVNVRRETNYERDRLDAGILDLVRTGKGTKGSWLKALIYDCIQVLLGPDAREPRIDVVLDELPKAAADRLAKKS